MVDLSPWESEILRFPCHVPGVLRRGSPVWAHGDAAVILGPDDTPECQRAGKWLAMPMSGEWVAEPIGYDGADWFAWSVPDESLSLDLQDATGRAHLALWLAGTLHPGDGPYIAAAVLPGRTIGPIVFGLSTISVEEGERWRVFDGMEMLNPLDPRTLPDGSRLVDALALGIIARHVAGLPIPVRP